MVKLREGMRVDRYRLLELLGEGGQGAVWKAEDPLARGRHCALKLLDLDEVRGSDMERTRREARALAKLEHPSICACTGLFEDVKLGVMGFAMDFVEGESLAAAVGSERLTEQHRGWLLTHIGAALAYIHQRGVVHRDIKPENVLLSHGFWSSPEQEGNVKLVDFGIASQEAAGPRLTQEGHIIGTPAYMAPEQLEPELWGADANPSATDVFAFGLLIWQLYVGGHPSGLRGDASPTGYAVRFRQAHREGSWPPHFPVGRWALVFRRCMGLYAVDRAQSGVELLPLLGEQPLRQPKAGHTQQKSSVATKEQVPLSHANTEPQGHVRFAAADQPTSWSESLVRSVSDSWQGVRHAVRTRWQASAARTVPDTMAGTAQLAPHGPARLQRANVAPRRRKSKSLVAGTVVLAASIVGSMLFFRSWREPSSTEPALLPSAAKLPVPAMSAPASVPPKVPVKKHYFPSARCSLETLCDANCCPAGYDCGGECSEDIPYGKRFFLRLGYVINSGNNKLDNSRVCVYLKQGHPPYRVKSVCMNPQRGGLLVSLDDLVSHGIGIAVHRGSTLRAYNVNAKHATGIRRTAICRGLVFRFKEEHQRRSQANDPLRGWLPGRARPASTVRSVLFHLDPPDSGSSRPRRCFKD